MKISLIMSKSKQRKLTLKQRKFIKEYIKTGNQTLAAKKSYNVSNDATARSIGSQNLTKLNIQNAVIKAQQKLGITDGFLAKKLKEGLNAKETKFFADKGVVKDSRNCIDYHTRARHLEIAHKLRGDFIDKAEIDTRVSAEDTLKKFVQESVKQTQQMREQRNERTDANK